MQQDNQISPNTADDEIDLRELWNTLMRRKWVVVITTALVLMASVVYVFTAPKVYEAKVTFQVGSYAEWSVEDFPVRLFETVDSLKTFINSRYSVSVSIPDKKAPFISLSANAGTPEKAVELVQGVTDDILSKHKRYYDSYVNSLQPQVEDLKKQIEYYSSELLPRLEQELSVLENLQMNRIRRNPGNNDLEIDMGYLLKEMMELKTSGIRELEIVTIPELKSRMNILQKLLEEPFLQKTALVGDISASSTPVKPKKKMVLAVALVAGLMMGVFLVFFLEFIKPKEPEN